MEKPAETIAAGDVAILRGLARRVRQIAEDPLNAERRRLWFNHAARQTERPMILAETGGVIDEMVPVARLKCGGELARGLERGLLNTLCEFEQVQDDHVVEPWLSCGWQVTISDYGVPYEPERADNAGHLGSYRWKPGLPDFPRDMDKIHPRTLAVDREATRQRQALLAEIFDGILEVRIRGSFWWTQGMTWMAAKLIGLEQLMLFMHDEPAGLHRLMAFLRDDHLALIDWVAREGLLTLNNANDYIGSGSCGYTRELPQPDYRPGQPARPRDLWVLSESQETVGVSPQMFAEFVLPYQLPIIAKFGLSYYGCCEPLHGRWEHLKKIPNLRRVSISPWCDEPLMAEALGRQYIYCRKPNPALISKERFDEDEIRADLRRTLQIARNCCLELAMKDVHTLCGQPERLGRWVALAREVSAEVWGVK